jgi:hypothetical protein
MKRMTLMILLVGGIFLLFQSFFLNRVAGPEIPEEVNQLLVSHCYHCHSTDGKSKKARELLNFEKWEDYQVTEQISLLDEVTEKIGNDEMPPGAYLVFQPKMKLDDSQKEQILKWAKETSDSLTKGN